MTPNRTIRRRAAFTLVELMVSAAVCVLIMAILSQAFVISTGTMRELKSTGDLMDQLRAAGAVLREDLSQNHFLPDDARPNLGLKLSDQRMDTIMGTGGGLGPTIDTTRWTPPGGGFFRARCTPSYIEGYDNDNLASLRAGGQLGSGHYLHFTSVKPGGRDQDIYSATVGALFSSRAAEIAYFLDPTPQGATGPGGPQYFNLIRRQRLVAMNGLEAANLPTTDASVVSLALPGGAVNTMASITDPRNRLGGRGTTLSGQPTVGGTDDYNLSPSFSRIGDDVLLSFVLSFEVKLQWQSNAFDPSVFRPRFPRPFADANNTLGAPQRQDPYRTDDEATGGPGSGSTDYPLDSLPKQSTNTNFDNLFVFDTWTTNTPTPGGWAVNRQPPAAAGQPQPPPAPEAIPMRVRVMKAKITIRVWDPKLKLTRQMTLFQDL